MKYIARLLFVLLFLSLVATSCSKKVVGARVHRRDRNCGCELVVPVSQDSTLCYSVR